MAREWLVIQSSMANAIFVPDEIRERKSYIPRDVAEKLLGRDLGGPQWFSLEESQMMKKHHEWRETEPPETASPVAEQAAAPVEERIAEWEELSKRATFSGVAYEELQSRAPEMVDWLISALRAALAKLAPFEKIYDDELSEIGDDISISLAVKLAAASADAARMRGALELAWSRLDPFDLPPGVADTITAVLTAPAREVAA